MHYLPTTYEHSTMLGSKVMEGGGRVLNSLKNPSRNRVNSMNYNIV